MQRYIGALEKSKQFNDLYENYGSSPYEHQSIGTEIKPTVSTRFNLNKNTDHYNEFVTSITTSRKKTTPLIVYKPFESRPTAGVYPAYSSTPLTSITTMTSSTRTSSMSTSKLSTKQSSTTTSKNIKIQAPRNDTIQASAKESSASQLIGNALFIILITSSFIF